jgi:hypothetical protein
MGRPQKKVRHFYIGFLQCGLKLRAARYFSPISTFFFSLHLAPIMSSIQIQCHGCDKSFTPRGLSQHVSRTPHPRCRAVYTASQLPSVSTSVPHTVSLPGLDSSHTSCDLGDDARSPGDEYNANIGALNPTMGIGMFTGDKVKPLEHVSGSHLYYR